MLVLCKKEGFMEISSVNSNFNFKRAIPVSTSIYYPNSGRALDENTIEVAKVLNSKKSSTYSQDAATKMKVFFKSVLGDYDGRSGIEFRKLPEQNMLVLLSGKDLNAIKRIEEEQRPIKKQINKSKTTSKAKKKKAISELHAKVDTEIQRRLENGVDGKTKAHLNFKNDYLTNKVTSIKYCMKQSFFSALVDGKVDNTKPKTHYPTSTNKAQNFIYEERSINCLA